MPPCHIKHEYSTYRDSNHEYTGLLSIDCELEHLKWKAGMHSMFIRSRSFSLADASLTIIVRSTT